LQSWSHGGTACVMGMLPWMVMFFLRKIGQQDSGVALYVREQLECIEFCLGMNDEQMESLRIRIKGKTNMGDSIVVVYYGPPNQEKEIDKAFYRWSRIHPHKVCQ